MSQYDYDLAVIGGGSAGSTGAKFGVMRNKKVALIERDKLGGTCLNYGCDPTKALLHAAEDLLCRRKSQSLDPTHDLEEKEWQNAMGRVRRLIDSIRGGSHEDAVERQQSRGIDVHLADAAFEDEHTIRLEDKSITAEKILIAPGMRPSVPPVDGLASTGYITNVQAVSLESLPSSLAIIGAGFIGVEFSQIFRRFGVEVTVLEMAPRIMLPADGEITDKLREYLEGEGIQFKLGVEISKVSKQGSQKKITYKCDDEEHSLEVDEILVAAGRRPATDSLELDKAGIEQKRGLIQVSDILQTSQEHIFAAGDVSGYPPFTHVAAPQGKLAVFNAFCQNPIPFNGTAIPAAAFTHP
ncbi:MAG: dihydrolipoyl dehydrogenase family protein, partial [Candidatus Sumerlaeota bacterium]